MVKALFAALVLFFGLSQSIVYAGGENHPFTLAGTVDILKSDYKGIVINDRSYKLSPNIIIHGYKNKIASRKDLKEGIKIGANIATASSSRTGMIYEIWLLPRNFDTRGLDMMTPTPR